MKSLPIITGADELTRWSNIVITNKPVKFWLLIISLSCSVGAAWYTVSKKNKWLGYGMLVVGGAGIVAFQFAWAALTPPTGIVN